MSRGDIESRLGEVVGEIRSLRPTLEAWDRRLGETRDRVIKVEEQTVHAARDREKLSRELSEAKARIFKALERLEGDVAGADENAEIEALELRIATLEKARDTNAGRVWDILKIVLAAVVGGVVSVFAKGMFS